MANEPTTTSSTPIHSADWLPRWEILALFLGDFVAMLLFGVWGQTAHGLLSSNEPPLRAVMNTSAPFMIAWSILGALMGAYRATALYPLVRTIWKTALTGLIAGPLGVVFWALARDHWPVPIFYVVTTGISTGMLLVWRLLWSRIRRLWWPELP